MTGQEWGPRRSRATTKPQPQCPEAVFFHCNRCGRVVLEAEPGQKKEDSPFCCQQPMEHLEPVSLDRLPETVSCDYKIVGGYNDNTLQVFWQLSDFSYRLKWVYLKTFTGGQIKYCVPSKRPPMAFALADEDAYAYCDRDPCLECVFCCKKGFVVYLYFSGLGLVEMPIDRMSPYWQSGARST